MNVSSARHGSDRTKQPENRAPARSRALTRQRILASATSLFAARGLHDVTSHDIASEAGVAAGTFYNHFKDKHALFREIVFETIERLQRQLVVALAGARGSPESVRRRVEALLEFAEQNRDLVRILFGRGSESSAHARSRVGSEAELGADVLDHLTRWVEQEIMIGAAASRPLHPGVAAQAIVGMWARTLAWWAEQPERASREQVVETIIELQLPGTSIPAESGTRRDGVHNPHA